MGMTRRIQNLLVVLALLAGIPAHAASFRIEFGLLPPPPAPGLLGAPREYTTKHHRPHPRYRWIRAQPTVIPVVQQADPLPAARPPAAPAPQRPSLRTEPIRPKVISGVKPSWQARSSNRVTVVGPG